MAMSAALDAHIQGLREAKAAFQRLPDVVRDRLLVATETTVREIARGAQARILASPSVRTRALLNAVAWRVSASNGRGRVGIAAGDASRRAHFVEFGTVKMAAEPFMLPAAESQKQPYLDRCLRQGPAIERAMVIGRTL